MGLTLLFGNVQNLILKLYFNSDNFRMLLIAHEWQVIFYFKKIYRIAFII